MEELLNKLIDKWWNPWWRGFAEPKIIINSDLEIYVMATYKQKDIRWMLYNINDLCSIDSWLFAFMVENALYNPYWIDTQDSLYEYTWWDVEEYFLIKSAITKDKEDFILDNIIV